MTAMMKGRPAAGRPRTFDENEAVEVALRAFWRSGYGGIGTRGLADAMGVGASSFANAFGSKGELLLRALERYDASVRAEVLVALDAADGRLALIGFVQALVGWLKRGEGGCLLLNLALEAGLDARSRRLIKLFVRDSRSALTAALERASPRLAPSRLETRADLAFLLVVGMSSAGRAGASKHDLERLAAAAVAQIDEWTGDVSSTSHAPRRRPRRTR